MTFNGESRANIIRIAAILCTVLSTSSFVLRIWGRWLSAAKLGWADLLMAVATFGCWAIAAVNLLALNYGFGHHVADLSGENIKDYIIALFVFFLLQTVTTYLIKLAILALYLQTFSTKRFQTIIYIVGAYITANSISILFGVCFYCTPIAHFWDPAIPGECIDEVVFTAIASATLLLTDLVLYILPMRIIWGLKMTTRRKMETIIMFVIGGFVCLTRIVQLVDTVQLDVSDLTWSNVDVAVWNMVESHIGCVAANIPLMRPIFARWAFKGRLPGYGSSSQREAHANQSMERRNIGYRGTEFGFQRMNDYGLGKSEVVAGSAGDSLEMNHVAVHGILVKTDLEQSPGKFLSSKQIL